jgi:hypothetical protein
MNLMIEIPDIVLAFNCMFDRRFNCHEYDMVVIEEAPTNIRDSILS